MISIIISTNICRRFVLIYMIYMYIYIFVLYFYGVYCQDFEIKWRKHQCDIVMVIKEIKDSAEAIVCHHSRK